MNTEAVMTPSMLEMQPYIEQPSMFLTQETGAIMMGKAVDLVIKHFEEVQTSGGCVYARKKELANRFSVCVNTMGDWLNTLEREGKIQPLQGAPSNGSAGDTLYKISEVEAALRERRKAYNERKNRGSKTTGK